MPRLDDPNTKLKNVRPFKRASLRPWDDVENFKPTFNIEKNKEGKIEEKPNTMGARELVPESRTISEQQVNQLVNKKGSTSKPISKQEFEFSGTMAPEFSIHSQLVNKKKSTGKPISKQPEHKNSKQLVNIQAVNINDLHSVINCVKSLVGMQKIFLYYVVENCKARGRLITDKLTNEFLRELLNASADTVKTIVQRVVNKGLVSRAEGKKGKGGYSIFETYEVVRNVVLEEQLQMELSKQLVNQMVNSKSKHIVNNLETNKVTDTYSSSSNIYNNTTTNGTDLDYYSVNINPLQHIGLTYFHIDQLNKQKKLSLEQIQDSIYYFAFDLSRNGKAKTLKKSPLEFFMGILRHGPYTPPSNYESPENESMRLYLESKARNKKINDELEKKLKETLWQEWKDTLSDQEILEYYVPGEPLDGVPEKIRATLIRRNAETHAYQYFESGIWPSKRKEILFVKNKPEETYES